MCYTTAQIVLFSDSLFPARNRPTQRDVQKAMIGKAAQVVDKGQKNNCSDTLQSPIRFSKETLASNAITS
nr:hypothetical transcript [Hymenolepis microstoma]